MIKYAFPSSWVLRNDDGSVDILVDFYEVVQGRGELTGEDVWIRHPDGSTECVTLTGELDLTHNARGAPMRTLTGVSLGPVLL